MNMLHVKDLDLTPPTIHGSLQPWTPEFKQDEMKDKQYRVKLEHNKEDLPEYIQVKEIKVRTHDIWTKLDERIQRRRDAVNAWKNRRIMVLETLAGKIQTQPDGGIAELAAKYIETLQTCTEAGKKEWDVQAAVVKVLEDAERQRKRVELLGTISELISHLQKQGDTV